MAQAAILAPLTPLPEMFFQAEAPSGVSVEAEISLDICVEPSGLGRSSRCSEPPVEGQVGGGDKGSDMGLGHKQKAKGTPGDEEEPAEGRQTLMGKER